MRKTKLDVSVITKNLSTLREALLIVHQSITVTVINLYGSDSVSKEASSCIYITLHNYYTDLPVWQREQPDQQ